MPATYFDSTESAKAFPLSFQSFEYSFVLAILTLNIGHLTHPICQDFQEFIPRDTILKIKSHD
jgi:hypothetical protein